MNEKMRLIRLEKLQDGKYLKKYALTYLNKEGQEKVFEIVSRRELTDDVSQLGSLNSGVSIAATVNGRLLLLKEFRMGVNKQIYNLCAGMFEEGESPEDCIRRELYEETGLSLKSVKKLLKPSYAAVAISDIKSQIAFVEAEGSISDHTSANEWIEAGLYSVDEVKQLLETEEFSSRAQLAAYMYVLQNGQL